MAFLTYRDFLTRITREDLAAYLNEPHQYETAPSELKLYDEDPTGPDPTAPLPVPAMTLLEQAGMDAEEEVASYLRGRYDMDAAYALTGTDRNSQLVMYLVDITIWHLTPRASYNQTSEIREKRYKSAIDWLKLVAAAKSNPKLPAYSVGEGSQAHRLFRWGSQETRSIDF